MPLILALESSCDETAVALYDPDSHQVMEKLHTQIAPHRPHGGIVPELASRDHIQRAIVLIDALFEETGCKREDLLAVGYTAGPGLMGALMVGASLGKSLAYSFGVPAIAVHHMEGHLLAPMLGAQPPTFPFLALLVSGGHTLLVDVRQYGDYVILGESVDDAAGEAFDKTARQLDLGYPGGPALAALAAQGNSGRFTFPRPMLHSGNLNFSFSGLKTAARQTIQAQPCLNEQDKADIACAFEEAVVDCLCHKMLQAAQQTGRDLLVIAGGVSANKRLRTQLAAMAEEAGLRISYPPLGLCTDNAAMIAYAAWCKFKAGQQDGDWAIQTKARWPITEA